MRLKMTGDMKRALLLLLLIISVLNLSAAFPMEPLQKTPVLIQPSDPQPSESVTLGNSQDMRVSSLGFRLKRASSVNTKKPARYCAGCFSVIGDPTRPEKLNLLYLLNE
ncbi:hypothetical protein cypCar_00034494 [Cyprinus carpio]|nr:hypothetical protein cypCar_00034494 [Cyprinus carpio]